MYDLVLAHYAPKHEKSLETQWFQGSLLWQGQKDSNPQQRFWRPTCYHYTMPLGSQQIELYGRAEEMSSIFHQVIHHNTGSYRGVQ